MRENKASGIKNFFSQGLSLRLLLALFDIVAVNVSYLATLVLRYFVNYQMTDKAEAYVDAFWQFAPYYTVFCLVVFACFRLYNGMWKYAGMHDLNRIVLANIVTAVSYVVGTLLFTKRMTISYYIIGAAIQVMLVVLIRFFPKVLVMVAQQARNQKAKINSMIVGISDVSQMVRSHIESDADNVTKPVCYLTTRASEAKRTINGLPVLTDISKLADYVSEYKIGNVIIADPLLPSANRKEIKTYCKTHNINLQDFSGYFQREGDAALLSNLLEYADGTVEIAIGPVTQTFENGEKALSALEGKYDIRSISGGQEKLIIRLAKHKSSST